MPDPDQTKRMAARVEIVTRAVRHLDLCLDYIGQLPLTMQMEMLEVIRNRVTELNQKIKQKEESK